MKAKLKTESGYEFEIDVRYDAFTGPIYHLIKMKRKKCATCGSAGYFRRAGKIELCGCTHRAVRKQLSPEAIAVLEGR